MNTTNINILKNFSSVVNREKLTKELYETLLTKWDLDKIDLDEEYIKLQTKKSSLSKSRRDAIPEFIRLRNLLKEKNEREQEQIIENNENDTLLTGGDFGQEITNSYHVESNSEIC